MPFKYASTVKITDRAIICGDFNCDMNEAETIFPGFTSFTNHNNTFITRRNNLINIAKYDYIMTNFNTTHSDLLVDKIDLSDHYPISSTLYNVV
jgi:endonuclease/exonuclease/phosphatase family metal-dependent hydrolase